MRGHERRVPTDTPAAEPAPKDLRSATANGAKLVMAGQLVRIVIQTLSVVVLARLLSPSDYGYFALALTVVSLGEVFRDFGLSTAAIQAPTLSRGQQSKLLWLNLGLGVALALACSVIGPMVTASGPYSGAGELLRGMAWAFVINGFLAQYRADLSRRLRFRQLVISDICGLSVGVILAIITAVLGAGVWALVFQQVGGLLVTAVLAVAFAGWLPGKWDRAADIKPMLRFGLGMVGTQLVGYLNNNVDTFVVAARAPADQLGSYNRAYQLLMQTLNQLRNPTTTIAVPVLSKLQGGGEEANRMLVRGQAALGYTLVAGTAFAAGAAPAIIDLALGPQWSQSATIFAILGVAGAFQTVGFVNYWVFVSRGLSGRLFGYSLVSVSIRVACVLVGSHWGVVGVAAGYALAPAIDLPLSYALLSRWTSIPRRALNWGATRIIGCAIFAGAVTRLVQHALAAQSSLVQIAVCALTTLTAYAAAAALLPVVRRDLRGVLNFARLALKSRSTNPTEAPSDGVA